ncbi:hypothetical protein [Bacillus marasmi]|uniref:hypothetical protein n=1 Tax=Bacillus marasmi TaxID=1926279 RepID=UPI0011C8A119|nr:hypothetical protein [Bacillus marasmi]
MNSEQVSSDTKLEALYDHYKESFVYIREYLKLRDKLFMLVLLVLTGMFLLLTVPQSSVDAVSQIVKEKLKLKLSMNIVFINSMFWFILLSLVVRYYQTSSLIERQYKYIHQVEKNLCNLVGEELFYREGKAYLNNYPAFSWWTWFLYTIFFPILLIVVTSYKMIIEFIGRKKIDINIILDSTFCSMILISTVLYLIALHSDNIKHFSGNILGILRKIRKSMPF